MHTHLSLRGGDTHRSHRHTRFAHVLSKIDIADIATQFEIVRNAPENYLEMVKIFVSNALYDYETVTKNTIPDSQISYVNQGFNNIVVRFGDQLLRIRKFIRKHMFKHDYILTTQLKLYSKVNKLNVLVPYQYHRNEFGELRKHSLSVLGSLCEGFLWNPASGTLVPANLRQAKGLSHIEDVRFVRTHRLRLSRMRSVSQELAHCRALSRRQLSAPSDDERKWFIYWTIPELTEIVEPFDYDKIRQTITTIADFLNRDGNTFTYIDFKRENFMLNRHGEYILADFDFTYALDLKMVMRNHKNMPVTDEVLDSIVGDKVKYYSDYELIRYPIAATYFGVKKDENGADIVDWDSISDVYDTKILVAMLVIRMFMIHMRRDCDSGKCLDYLELTKDDIQKMITMKSTKTVDVLDGV